MKTSNKILFVYLMLVPLILIVALVNDHDFGKQDRLRFLYRHPSKWNYVSVPLIKDQYTVINANFAAVIFSDTIPTNTLGYQYVHPYAVPFHEIVGDTLHLRSLYLPMSGIHTAYFFLNPKEELSLVGNSAKFLGNFNKVTAIDLGGKNVDLEMYSGRLSTFNFSSLQYGRIVAHTDSVSGELYASTIILNEDVRSNLALEDKSRLNLSDIPLSKEAHLSSYMMDPDYRIFNWRINEIINLNLADSTYQAQIPPR